MTIDRHNYEEFFILYMDNELSTGDRAQVELFVQSHPDLAEELAMLQQTQVTPDTTEVYNYKETLMMTAGQSFINADNYEECLLLYIDNELNSDQRNAVEKFVAQSVIAKKELDLLLKTKLQPEASSIYFNKESLYRTEEKERRVIPFNWRRLAAAAILLFVVGGSAVLYFNNKGKNTETGVASMEKGIKTPPVTTKPVVTPPKNEQQQTEVAVTTNPDNPVADAGTKKVDQSSSREIKEANEKRKTVTPSLQDEQPVLASNTDINNGNGLPQPQSNRNIQTKIDQPIAFTDVKTLTNQKENSPSFAVTLPVSPTYNNQTDEQPEKKNKLRGLLRKVTRTIEKTTNIKATDENDRLLVGGLAIQL
jgi:hypothetical protein